MIKTKLRKKKIEEISFAITRNITDDINKIFEVLALEFDDIIQIIDNVKNIKDKNKIILLAINKQLKNLEAKLTIKKYKQLHKKVESVTYYYVSKEEDFEEIVKVGNNISKEILFYLINKNIDLPINIVTIKKYFISTNIKENQLYKILIWILIYYISISKSIVWL